MTSGVLEQSGHLKLSAAHLPDTGAEKFWTNIYLIKKLDFPAVTPTAGYGSTNTVGIQDLQTASTHKILE
ncbi:unnamed protein product [Caretta caretta]